VAQTVHDSHDPERKPLMAQPLYVSRFEYVSRLCRVQRLLFLTTLLCRIKGLSRLEFTVTSPMIESVTRYLVSCREADKRMKTLEENNESEVGKLTASMRQYHPWVVVNSTGEPLLCGVTRNDELLVRCACCIWW
jgi:hypothetical protein